MEKFLKSMSTARAGIVTFLVIMLSIPQILSPVIASWRYGEDSFFEDWSPEQTFTEDYAVSVEKRVKDRDEFVILNLTDVQLNSCDAYDRKGRLATAIIDELVEKTQPDLITMTGDNAWCTSAYLKLIKDLEKQNIPWAPIMGNHDGQGLISEFWAAYLMADAKNCVFKLGPKNMGYGNYIVNLTEDGKIVHTLFMMDTHAKIEDEGNINGAVGENDNFWPNQFEWYKWAVEGIAKIAGHTVDSTVFMHIPLYEYRLAWAEGQDAETTFGDQLDDDGICSPEQSNGFFQLAKDLGSTKDFIAGHDHSNNFSVLYQGIRLTYAMKCGAGCYWREDMSGGTTITVDKDGKTHIEHVYIPLTPEDF